VLLAVIKAWASIADAAGNWRIDPDFVALKWTALKRQIRIIPVLVGGVDPKAEQLPPDLQKLVELDAITVDDSRFRQD
jgi:hypothetical protein